MACSLFVAFLLSFFVQAGFVLSGTIHGFFVERYRNPYNQQSLFLRLTNINSDLPGSIGIWVYRPFVTIVITSFLNRGEYNSYTKTIKHPEWSNSKNYLASYTNVHNINTIEVTTGWPLRCVVAENMHGGSGRVSLVSLPGLTQADYSLFDMHWRYLWWRGAANIIFWTCMLLLLRVYMPRAIRFLWRLRSILRVRRGQCSSCGYPIPGQAICPECGTRVDAKTLL